MTSLDHTNARWSANPTARKGIPVQSIAQTPPTTSTTGDGTVECFLPAPTRRTKACLPRWNSPCEFDYTIGRFGSRATRTEDSVTATATWEMRMRRRDFVAGLGRRSNLAGDGAGVLSDK